MTGERDEGLPAGLADRLAREDRGWRRVRSWSTPLRRGIAILALAVLVLLVAMGSRRADWDVLPIARVVVAAAGLLVAALLVVRLGLHPPHRRSPVRGRVATALLLALALPVVVAALPPAHDLVHAHPESFEGTGADFLPRALACLLFGTLVGLPAALFLRVADRAPATGGVRTWAAAGLGGLAGTLALLVHCPLVSTAHRLAGHAMVPLVVAAVVVAADRLLRRAR